MKKNVFILVLWHLKLLFIYSLFLSVTCSVNAQERIISIGADVTEIIYQLGAGDKIVGRDMRSLYPPEAAQLPDVGYIRRLNAEGLLSLRPSMIITSELAAPPLVFEQVKNFDVPVVFISGESSIQGMLDRIKQVSIALSLEDKGQTLIEQTQAKLALIPDDKIPVRVLFIRNFNGNTLSVAGKNTIIDNIITIAGLENALNNVDRYQTVSGESLLSIEPDLILITESTMNKFQSMDDFWNLDQLSNTPAGKNKNVVVIDDIALLSFGLRTPDAILTLHQAAHDIQTRF